MYHECHVTFFFPGIDSVKPSIPPIIYGMSRLPGTSVQQNTYLSLPLPGSERMTLQ